ncbi:MAG TPA: NACHT domain-containing protein, partial [Waterburya sp.]
TYSKLRVLGKPGSGKTTFLQHLAIECNQGKFAANRVPIFITLRDFADESKEAGHTGDRNQERCRSRQDIRGRFQRLEPR